MVHRHNDNLLAIGKSGILERASKDLENTADSIIIVNKADELLYMTRLSKSVLMRLYNQAKNGSRESMHSVSMLYFTGFGLEQSKQKALRWSSLSLLEPADLPFDECVAELKKDIKLSLSRNSGSEYVYPEFRTELPNLLRRNLINCPISYESMAEKLNRAKVFSLALYPVFAGVRTTLVYKVTESGDCYLYDAFLEDGSDEDRFAIDIASFLNIPKFLGEIRNNRTVPDYPKRMSRNSLTKFKYFAVRGVLVVPNSKKPLLLEKFPDVNNTLDLVQEFLKSFDKVRHPFVGNSEEIQKLEKSCEVLKKKARSFYVKRKKNSISLKRKYKEAKQQIKELLEQDTVNKEDFLSRYPEYFLRFIGTEIAGVTSNFDIHRLYLKPSDQPTHLSSLGFMTMSHPMFWQKSICTLEQCTERKLQNYAKAISELYQDEYKIAGVLVQPNKAGCYNNRKDKQRYIYKL